MTLDELRRSSSSARCCSTGTPRRSAMQRDRGRLRRRRGGPDRRRGDRPDALARRPVAARSTTATSTCRAARSSTRRSRTRSRARSTFSEFPAVYFGNEVEGARFVFERGRIVEATAREGEAFLLQTLDTDEGARRLGELGIGCNPGIQRFMKNVGVRREDRRHDPSRGRQLVQLDGREEPQLDPLGHRQGPAPRWADLRRRPARPGERALVDHSRSTAAVRALARRPPGRAPVRRATRSLARTAVRAARAPRALLQEWRRPDAQLAVALCSARRRPLVVVRDVDRRSLRPRPS